MRSTRKTHMQYSGNRNQCGPSHTKRAEGTPFKAKTNSYQRMRARKTESASPRKSRNKRVHLSFAGCLGHPRTLPGLERFWLVPLGGGRGSKQSTGVEGH